VMTMMVMGTPSVYDLMSTLLRDVMHHCPVRQEVHTAQQETSPRA
jgi:hypothetical protein